MELAGSEMTRPASVANSIRASSHARACGIRSRMASQLARAAFNSGFFANASPIAKSSDNVFVAIGSSAAGAARHTLIKQRPRILVFMLPEKFVVVRGVDGTTQRRGRSRSEATRTQHHRTRRHYVRKEGKIRSGNCSLARKSKRQHGPTNEGNFH